MLDSTIHTRLIILDPSLKHTGGHYYEYDAAIGAAAIGRHMRVQIYAHKSCEPDLSMPGCEIFPWFSTEWGAAGGGLKRMAVQLLGKLPIALCSPSARLGRLLWSKIKQKKPQNLESSVLSSVAKTFGLELTGALHHAGSSDQDLIFIPTIRTRELFALWKASRGTQEKKALQFHIVLRRDAAEMDMPEDGAPGVSQILREISAAPERDSFRFYCDTEQLCDDYACLSELKFRLLPIPFPRSNPDPAALQQWSGGTRTKLVYLGDARVEKGFHLLSAAEKFLHRVLAGKLLWRLQVPRNSALEEPDVIAARRYLSSVRDGSVELIDRNLASTEFQSLLLSADIVLLPYLAEYYRARSSGILVQVLAAGKPVIVPAKSWLSGQANQIGVVEFSSPADLPNAIFRAVQELPRLSMEARDRAPSYAARHNADALLTVLQNSV